MISSIERARDTRTGKFALTRSIITGEQAGFFVTEEGKEATIPSEDMAWMLGTLASGGDVKGYHSGRFRITSYDRTLLDAFQICGQNLFGIEGRENTLYTSDDGREYKEIAFIDPEIVAVLGDLQAQWPKTIAAKHSWIYEDATFMWKFVEGFFEMRGVVGLDGNRGGRNISMDVSHIDSANGLFSMWKRLGVKNPKISFKAAGDIRGVAVYNLEDICYIAQHIHSVLPKKEERLEHYRIKELSSRHYVHTSAIELAEEYVRVSKDLGHPPSYTEMQSMRPIGTIKYDIGTYKRRFGDFETAKTIILEWDAAIESSDSFNEKQTIGAIIEPRRSTSRSDEGSKFIVQPFVRGHPRTRLDEINTAWQIRELQNQLALQEQRITRAQSIGRSSIQAQDMADEVRKWLNKLQNSKQAEQVEEKNILEFLQYMPGIESITRRRIIELYEEDDTKELALQEARRTVGLLIGHQVLTSGVREDAVITMILTPIDQEADNYYSVPLMEVRWKSPAFDELKEPKDSLSPRQTRQYIGGMLFFPTDKAKEEYLRVHSA